MNEKFYDLSEEKQSQILNAAYKVFATNQYKKAPTSEIAAEAGIATDRAVVVNERMETSLPDIYACGDCAQYEGINYAIWPEASEQGTVAGANAAGEQWGPEAEGWG